MSPTSPHAAEPVLPLVRRRVSIAPADAFDDLETALRLPTPFRRGAVRVLGTLLIAASLVLLWRVGNAAPGRRAVLDWAAFGFGAEVEGAASGAASLVGHLSN